MSLSFACHLKMRKHLKFITKPFREFYYFIHVIWKHFVKKSQPLCRIILKCVDYCYYKVSSVKRGIKSGRRMKTMLMIYESKSYWPIYWNTFPLMTTPTMGDKMMWESKLKSRRAVPTHPYIILLFHSSMLTVHSSTSNQRLKV